MVFSDRLPGPLTVGDLFGRRQDDPVEDLPILPVSPPGPAHPPATIGPARTAAARIGDIGTQESTAWRVRGGIIESREPVTPLPQGIEALDYNNPYGQEIERVWFEGMLIYAVDLGEIEVDPEKVKVAQEYVIVYDARLDEAGRPDPEPDPVPGQYNVYDSVPGMEKYSPIWQFNYVIVPPDYQPNTLRSEADCLASGYPIVRSTRFEN